MGTILFITLSVASLAALFAPWCGVIAGYVYILLGPQVLWWWSFGENRIFLFIALCSFIGLIFSIVKGDVDSSYIKNKQNLCLIIWFFCIVLSFISGPYVHGGPGPRFFNPEYILDIVCKSFLFYFISVLCINNDEKYKYLCVVIVFVSIYYIYWINDRYLSGFYGRLGGPTSLNQSQYGDENNFAMFFVISLPFIYFFGSLLKNKIYKYLIWLIIPFGWHAVFLTGSRGGMLGICATLIVIIIRSSKKSLALLIIPIFAVAFYLQGGSVMKERTSTINSSAIEYEEVDASVQGRYDAWKAAIKMIASHPLTGVGVASFGAAFPDFSDKQPRECHNTYLQIGAESGIVAMFSYISFLVIITKRLWQIKPTLFTSVNRDAESHFSTIMHDAVLSSWIGFIVCACFLSLQAFEQFFYLAILSNYLVCQSKEISSLHNTASSRS